MMPYNLLITIECKNKKSIFYFSLLLNQFLKNLIIKYKKPLKNFYKFTLLKSPHVHKSAQHEFKQQTYKKQLVVIIFDNKTLILFKKLFFNLYQDIKKKFTFFIKSKNFFFNLKFFKLNIINNFFCLNNNCNFYFSILNQKENIIIYKLQNYFKILNLIGKNKISLE